MGTWSYPGTETKANELKSIMNEPLTRKKAEDDLYELCGDDDLFDEFFECDPNDDVSDLVRYKLAEWLNNIHYFRKPWEPEALEICRKIVAQDADIYEATLARKYRF